MQDTRYEIPDTKSGQPDNADALHKLGVIAHQRGDYQSAVNLISKATVSNPQEPRFYNNLGVALKTLGRKEEAVRAYEKALSLNPSYADARYNLGNILGSTGQYEKAVEQYERVLLLKPNDAFTYYNIAVAMQELGRHGEAVENFDRAISLGHNPTEVYRAMAASQKTQGRNYDAIDTLRQALQIKPDCAKTHTDLGMLLLLIGDFKQGWGEYYWRMDGTEWTKHFPNSMRWTGKNFTGKRLFVRCEQGLGDNIQFVRYLPAAKSRGGTVIWGVYDELYNLLKDFPGADQTINLTVENQLPQFDFYVPIMDLPGIFGTPMESGEKNYNYKVPYIFADTGKIKYWSRKIRELQYGIRDTRYEMLKIGIVWSGSYGRGGKHLRNCRLTDFAQLASIEGVKLYSLQKGRHAEQQLEETTRELPVVNLGSYFNDFTDTAAAIENMDLVISVDTSVLHLAGAMGKPTWSLQCFAPDWRWLLDRDDSPWYPTMKLFRQQKLGQWDDIFARMKEQLQILVSKEKVSV